MTVCDDDDDDETLCVKPPDLGLIPSQNIS